MTLMSPKRARMLFCVFFYSPLSKQAAEINNNVLPFLFFFVDG